MFDGNTVTAIGDPISNFFFKDLTSVNKIIGYYDWNSKDIIFAYDNTGKDVISLNRAIVYNMKTNTWSYRDMGMTAIGDYGDSRDLIIDEMIDTYNSDRMSDTMIDESLYRKESTIPVIGTYDGKVYKLSGWADSRGDYDGYVVTKTHHMEDPLHIKRLLRIQFHVESQPNCEMYVMVRPSWNAETPDEGIDWSHANQFSFQFRDSDSEKPVQPPFVDVDLSARYFQIKFGTRKNNEYFKVLGYTLLYQTRGEV